MTWSAYLPGAYQNVGPLGTGIAWGYYMLLVPQRLFIPRRWLIPSPRRTFSRRVWQRAQLGVAALFIAATGTATLLPHTSNQVTITFLHVGPAGKQAQGEAILIRTPDDKTILVNT